MKRELKLKKKIDTNPMLFLTFRFSLFISQQQLQPVSCFSIATTVTLISYIMYGQLSIPNSEKGFSQEYAPSNTHFFQLQIKHHFVTNNIYSAHIDVPYGG